MIDKLSSDGTFSILLVAFCAAFVSQTTNRFQYTTDQLELSTVPHTLFVQIFSRDCSHFTTTTHAQDHHYPLP